jgi:serine protease inhibitor
MMQQMLLENGGENAVCSPLNIYMALAMLAECTDGNSRAQILSLLGDADVENLRARVDDLWNDTYREDGLMNRVLAGAVWLDKGVPFHQKTLDALAQHYYAASFQGDMDTEAYNQALRDWLNSEEDREAIGLSVRFVKTLPLAERTEETEIPRSEFLLIWVRSSFSLSITFFSFSA